MRTLSLLLFFLVSVSAVRAGSLSAKLQQLEKKLSLRILYDSVVTDSWQGVSYQLCTDSAEVISYLRLLDKEYSKYPGGYFERASVRTIVLGKQLRYQQQYRSAVPDPYIKCLFFSIDGQNGSFTETYLIHVLHHELNHCAEYGIWKDMRYEWKKWRKCNHSSFHYGNGGASAYEQTSIDWYAMTHPQKGFINLYSTTAQEEDRSELIALIMTDEERKYIFEYCRQDKILRKKVKIVLRQLDKFCNTSDNYWQQSMNAMGW